MAKRKTTKKNTYTKKELDRIRVVAFESYHARHRELTDFEIEVLNEIGEGDRAKWTLKRREKAIKI